MRLSSIKQQIKFIIFSSITFALVLLVSFDGAFVVHDTIDSNLYEKPLEFEGEGIGVYTINLDRHEEKYKTVYPQLKQLGLPLCRIRAIDAVELSNEEMTRYMDVGAYQSYWGHNPKSGTVGCFLSHIKAWQEFLRSNYEFALITEDDIEFDPKVLKENLAYLIKNKELWDLNTFQVSLRGLPVTIKEFDSHYKLSVYLSKIEGAAAYLISRKTAYKLLKNALPMKMDVDYYMSRGWELDLLVTGIEPRIIRQKKGESYRRSTLFVNGGKYTNMPIAAYIHQFIFAFKTELLRAFYNVKAVFLLRKPE